MSILYFFEIIVKDFLYLLDSCLHSITCAFILFPIFQIIFSITLTSFSGRLPIFSSFVWSYRFLSCSLICYIFLCLFIFFNLLCLIPSLCQLEDLSSYLWSLFPVCGVWQVPCKCFMVGRNCVCVLVDEAGFYLSKWRCCVQDCVLVCLWNYYGFGMERPTRAYWHLGLAWS